MTDQILGVLDVRDRGDGFLRRREHAYLPENGDVFVGQGAIRRFGLRTGDVIAGELEQGKGRGKGPALARVTLVNGLAPEAVVGRADFGRLTAIHPNERLKLETDANKGTPLPPI